MTAKTIMSNHGVCRELSKFINGKTIAPLRSVSSTTTRDHWKTANLKPASSFRELLQQSISRERVIKRFRSNSGNSKRTPPNRCGPTGDICNMFSCVEIVEISDGMVEISRFHRGDKYPQLRGNMSCSAISWTPTISAVSDASSIFSWRNRSFLILQFVVASLLHPAKFTYFNNGRSIVYGL